MSERRKCQDCDRVFGSSAALAQHRRDKHPKDRHGLTDPKTLPKDVRREIACEVFGDLPDGAFFAAAESEFGLEPMDFVDQ